VPLVSDPDSTQLRHAFAKVPSGVAALAALVDGAPQGLVVSTFTVGVSLDPPLVMFAVQNSSRTWPVLRGSARLGVSVLSAHQEHAARQIASKDGDRFAGLPVSVSSEGALLLPGAALWLDCSVEQEVPAGDHAVVLLRVHGHEVREGHVDPLVFHSSTFTGLRQPALV